MVHEKIGAKSDDITERQAFLILNALPKMGPVTLNRLLADLEGDPRAVLLAGARRLDSVKGIRSGTGGIVANWRKHFDLAREEEAMSRSGADFVIPNDAAYPELLRQIYDPPIALYRKGRYGFEHGCIAIVGSRRTTSYGLQVARKLAGDLVTLGFCVVSGLARGIDTAAHEGALEAGGATAAVLGCGLDIIYPPENLDLYRRIGESGAVISEFPFGKHTDRQTFAMRNRIVSGICLAVVVIESDVDGGAMITARFAGEQGRTVFAVPGRIDQRTSAGCNQLIRDGAVLLTGVEDILEEMAYLGGMLPMAIPEKEGGEEEAAPVGNLSTDEKEVFKKFKGGAILAPDALAAQTGLSSAVLASALMMLEIKNLVTKRLDGCYESSL